MKFLELLPFIVTITLLQIQIVKPLDQLFRFERKTVLNDKKCKDSEIVFMQSFLGYGESGVSLCSTRCSGFSNCTGIFYNVETGMCTGCDGNYNASSLLVNSSGTEYFKRMTMCVTYGTTFQVYPGRRIHNDNMYSIHYVSLNECLQECISNTQCHSVDYGHSSVKQYCNIQSSTPLTTSSFVEEIALYDLYVRDCA